MAFEKENDIKKEIDRNESENYMYIIRVRKVMEKEIINFVKQNLNSFTRLRKLTKFTCS